MISVPSLCQSICNTFSPSQLSQIFWNFVSSYLGKGIYGLFFISAKFGPPGPKNGLFWPLFFAIYVVFRNFTDFFNMTWGFWACLKVICKKIVKKGSKFGLQCQKIAIFCQFCRFWTKKSIQGMCFSNFSIQ